MTVGGLRGALWRPVLLLFFAVDIVAMVLAMPRALFPELADTRFGGGPAVGWLFAAIAIGSVAGGLVSGWIGRVRRQGLALIAADLVSAVFRQTILQVYAPTRCAGACRASSSWWSPAGRESATCGPAAPPP